MNTITLGIVGAGEFLSGSFLPVFVGHPGISRIFVADLVPERAERLVARYGLAGAASSLEDLLRIGVDAVAIFTPRHTHAALAREAMEAGCHAYMAVPAAVSLEELAGLIEVSRRTRRVCVTGETSFYYPEVVYCREEFASGRWGNFVHADAQYIHDMATWGLHFRLTYGDDWRRYATIPPMHYATHSFSMPLSITSARVTHVSAHGFRDLDPASGYAVGENPWDNVFSNEVALGRTSDGGTIRVGEFRRLGWFARRGGREVMMPSFYCTDACFEENMASSVVTARRGNEGGQDWEHRGLTIDVAPWIDGPYFAHTPAGEPRSTEHLGLAPAHHAERLPDALRGVQTGHSGSHHFLVDDFVRGCLEDRLPPCNIWNSANWCAPGIVAHESAKRGGETLAVPDFGAPPADWKPLQFPARAYDGRRPMLPPLAAASPS